MIPAGHSSAGGPSVAGHPGDMAAYADELTEMDMAAGRAANQLRSKLESLFERQTREVDMVHRPGPTIDDRRLASRIVDHATAVNEADGWVGMVGRALFLADGRDGYNPHDRHSAVSQQDLDDALAQLFPPLSPTGNVVDDPAADEEWRSLANCGERGYGSLVGGVLIGPDGRSYPVATPGVQTDESARGWSTVGGSRQGELVLGEPLSGFEEAAVIAGAAIGGGQKMFGWQSLGTHQSRYLTTFPDGSATLNDGTGPGHQYGRPPGGGSQSSTHDDIPREIDVSERDWRNRLNRVDRAGDRVDMAIGAMEGIGNVQQAENNLHYVSQVVFQQHVDGPRRAVIHIYQVQSDGTRVRVARQYGKINPDGTVGTVS